MKDVRHSRMVAVRVGRASKLCRMSIASVVRVAGSKRNRLARRSCRLFWSVVWIVEGSAMRAGSEQTVVIIVSCQAARSDSSNCISPFDAKTGKAVGTTGSRVVAALITASIALTAEAKREPFCEAERTPCDNFSKSRCLRVGVCAINARASALVERYGFVWVSVIEDTRISVSNQSWHIPSTVLQVRDVEAIEGSARQSSITSVTKVAASASSYLVRESW